jgi:hypothetical protein
MNKIRHPKALTFTDVSPQSIDLIVHGQGVLLFTSTGPCCLTFSDQLRMDFTETAIEAIQFPQMNLLIDPKNTQGIEPTIPYWVSIDSQNRWISAGIGEARIENTLYRYEFQNKSILAPITTIALSADITAIRLLRDPITRTVPLIVRPTDDLTMNDIAGGSIVAKSHLSPVAHKLFDCVSGKKFVLDGPDFPEFSQAIEYSIADPNGWCNKRLLEKSREFGEPNLLETYLRITIGENNGESPGIPYVMEIWPPQHYSPIHNHGGANAIIRVLNGQINVALYPYLGTTEPFAKADFVKDDITWLSPTLNQVHKLTNLGKSTCITIQCYLYDLEDKDHYDYFDYIDGQGRIQQYEPDSDMDFAAFKELMRQEWLNRNLVATSKGSLFKRMLCRK